MSWLEKLLPPKILHTDPADRRSVPEGLWIKCPNCDTVLYKTDLEQNQNVCPTCSHHHRIGARARLDVFLDNEGRGPGLMCFWTTRGDSSLGRKCCRWMRSSSRTAASTPSV